MTRRLLFAAVCAAALLAALGTPAPQAAQAPATSGSAPAGPIKLVRHPDYHAGKIAFSYFGDIWTANEDGSQPERLTINTARETFPRFSPDGRSIAFTSDRSGTPQIYIMDATGSSVRRLTSELSYCDAPSWSIAAPDEMIAFTARVPGGFDIYVQNLKTGTLSRLTDGSDINEWPRWSPNGRHIVFASNRSGSFDVYTMDVNGDHVRRLTRGGSNSSPSWSR